LLQASRESALGELKDHGFPNAKVLVGEDPGSSDRSKVITLTAEPGALSYFGPINIQGNSSVGDEIIRRQLTYRPGQVFRESRLIESQRRLYTLEVFQFASVKAPPSENLTQIPTNVTVTEGKHRKVNLDLGYGSEERARAEIDWRHVNFFGGARTAQVLARYSGLDRGVRLNLTEPYIFSRNYSLTVSGQLWHNDEPAFTLDTQGGQVTITRRFGRTNRPGITSAAAARLPTTLSFGYANEWEDYTISEDTLNDPTQRDEIIALGLDPRTRSGSGRRSAILLDAGRNTTGNILDARRGYLANLHFEQAGRWLGGDFDYYEATFEGRYFQSLGSSAVLAVRARGGSVAALGTADQDEVVPFYKRYFLGGATTLRGWGRYDVAPLDSTGEPIGGQTVLNFSTELRFPIKGRFSGVLFLDGGNVWVDPWAFNLNDMRYDVGPGLRYNTPIGPVRLDVGYQLNPIPGLILDGKPQSRQFRVHFSIGQAF
jgi:outer membrane protein insertion porin family/translocation and assembly module TamA